MGRFVSLLLGYVFGNFLTAEVVSRRISGKSVFDIGTGNPGMANIVKPRRASPCRIACRRWLGLRP